MDELENRWMPPSPHREKILEEIASGAAHIVERGHGVPPLLVFEDGGMIELPRVRLQETRRGPQLTASDEPGTRGETHFYDVCGTADEIIGRVQEAASQAEPDSAYLASLVDDIAYMLARMIRRNGQYRACLEQVRDLAEQRLAEPEPDAASAPARIAALHDALAAQGTDPLRTGEIVTRVEHARALAQSLEDHLAREKETVMDIARLCAEVKGGRNWPEPGVAQGRTEQAQHET